VQANAERDLPDQFGRPDARTPARLRALAALGALALGFLLADQAATLIPPAHGASPMQLASIRPGVWFAIAAGLGVGATLCRGRAFRVLTLAWIVALGAGWHSARVLEPAPGARVLAQAAAERAIVTIEGVALDDAAPLPPPRDAIRPPHRAGAMHAFDFAVARVQSSGPDAWTPVRARVRVLVAGEHAEPVRAGSRVRLTGTLLPIEPPLNPGEADRRRWANQSSHAGTIRVTPALIEPVDDASPGVRTRALGAWSAWRASLRTRAARALGYQDAIPRDPLALDPGAPPSEQGRALVAAITLGQRTPALREAEGAFRRVGLSHLMAISGFHVVVLTGLLLVVIRCTGDRGWVEPAVAAGIVMLYLVLVPAHAPVVRAGVMVLALLLSEALGRRHDRVAVLAWVAVAMLIWRPLELFTLGFQLSFGLTGALLWIGMPFHNRVFPAPILPTKARIPLGVRMMLAPLRGLFSTSLLCWTLAVPIVLAHTGHISPVGIIATIAATPIIVLALWVGYGALLLGMIAPVLSAPASWLIEAIGLAAVRTGELFDRLPGSLVQLPTGEPWVPAPLLAGVGVIGLLLVMGTARVRRMRRRIGLAMLLVWVLSLSTLGVFAHKPGIGVLMRLDTLAVGDGACHLVRTRRAAIFWDCGSLRPGLGVRTGPDAFRALGVRRVHAAVVTHPDVDHFAALADLAPRVGLRHLVVGEAFLEAAQARPDAPPAQLLARLETLGVAVHTVEAGDVLTFGDLRLTFLHPPPGFVSERDNEHSLVAVVEPIRRAREPWKEGEPAPLLLTGDIERGAIAELARAHPTLTARVLELPHHGSAHDAAYAFVARTRPEFIIQSTGPTRVHDPRWDHARAAVTRWITTAHDGAATVEWQADGTIRARAFRTR